jgi:hypothetical protein
MILVAIVAELMEDYTVLVARVLEQLLNGASSFYGASPSPPPLQVATRG